MSTTDSKEITLRTLEQVFEFLLNVKNTMIDKTSHIGMEIQVYLFVDVSLEEVHEHARRVSFRILFGWNVIQPWSIKFSFIKRLYHDLLEIVGRNAKFYRDMDFKISHIIYYEKAIIVSKKKKLYR